MAADTILIVIVFSIILIAMVTQALTVLFSEWRPRKDAIVVLYLIAIANLLESILKRL